MALPILELGLAAQTEAAQALIEHLEDKDDARGLFLLCVLLNVQRDLLKSTAEAWSKRLHGEQ